MVFYCRGDSRIARDTGVANFVSPDLFLLTQKSTSRSRRPPAGGCARAQPSEARLLARSWEALGRRNLQHETMVTPPQAMGSERGFENKQAQPQSPADLVSQAAVLRNTGLRACASVRIPDFSQPPSFRLSSFARRVQVDRRSPGR